MLSVEIKQRGGQEKNIRNESLLHTVFIQGLTKQLHWLGPSHSEPKRSRSDTGALARLGDEFSGHGPRPRHQLLLLLGPLLLFGPLLRVDDSSPRIGLDRVECCDHCKNCVKLQQGKVMQVRNLTGVISQKFIGKRKTKLSTILISLTCTSHNNMPCLLRPVMESAIPQGAPPATFKNAIKPFNTIPRFAMYVCVRCFGRTWYCVRQWCVEPGLLGISGVPCKHKKF